MTTWNRDDTWEVQRIFTERARLVVRIPQDGNRTSHLAALRRCSPELAVLAPSELLRLINDAGEIDLGDMAGRAARHLAGELEKQGASVKAINTSHTDFLPINRTSSSMWLIEDPVEARRIAEEMMAAGVPVVDVQA